MTNTVAAAQDIAEEAPEKFQVYTSAKQSFRMVTPEGKVLLFIGGRLMTKEPKAIAYLDEEIAEGCRFLTKGEPMTAAEADPIASLRQRIIAEHEADKAKKEAAVKDMGSTPKAPLGAANTALLAALKSDSNSAPAAK